MATSQNTSRPCSRGIISVPLLRAFFLQALALVVVFLLLHSAWRLTGAQLTPLGAALLQGAMAALLSWGRLPAWWMPIQFLLAPALVMAHALAWPSWIYLAAFLILLALYWNTFCTRVPYYPSGRAAWEKVAGLLPAHPSQVIDIGSGFGGLMLHLARQRPDSTFAGIEIAPLPWLVSTLRARMAHWRGIGAPDFVRGDYTRLDFSQYDVIFAYLSPAAMPLLRDKARSEMRAGSLLLSYEFELSDLPPDFSVATESGRLLHGWRI